MEINPVKETPDIRSTAESLIRYSRDYTETQINLLLLTAKEKSASTLAGLAKGTLLAVIGMISLLFLSAAVATYIGVLTGKPFIGFLIVSGFYLLTCIILYLFRNTWIYHPLFNQLIQKFSSDEKD